MNQTSILRYSYFKPHLGGHAPGDLRDAFGEAIDAYEAWEEGEPEPNIEVRGRAMSLRAVCGLLWNCSDIMPSMLMRQMDDLKSYRDNRHFGSYARAARFLRELVDREAVR
jgi:hypothetical protein